MSQMFVGLLAVPLLFSCGDDPPRDRRVSSDTTNSDMGGANNSHMNNGRGRNNGTSTNGNTNNATLDMGTGDDAGMGADDMGMLPDMGDELPTGEICPYTDLEPFTGLCDPVRITGCSGAMECLPAVRIIGPDALMSAQCDDATNHTLAVGDNCQGTEQRCAPGSTCITFYQECRKLCYPDTSLGCEAGEFCRRPSASWQGLGFCDTTCNL